jgi:hypothetical protein
MKLNLDVCERERRAGWINEGSIDDDVIDLYNRVGVGAKVVVM